MKREVRTRLDLLRPNTNTRVQDKQAQQKVNHDRHAKAREFAVNDPVFVKNFRPGPDWIPAIVVAKLGPLSYLVETTDKQLWRRHVDHVKSRSATVIPASTAPSRVSDTPAQVDAEVEPVTQGVIPPAEATGVELANRDVNPPVTVADNADQVVDPGEPPPPDDTTAASTTASTTTSDTATSSATPQDSSSSVVRQQSRQAVPPDKTYELRRNRVAPNYWRGTCKTIYV